MPSETIRIGRWSCSVTILLTIRKHPRRVVDDWQKRGDHPNQKGWSVHVWVLAQKVMLKARGCSSKGGGGRMSTYTIVCEWVRNRLTAYWQPYANLLAAGKLADYDESTISAASDAVGMKHRFSPRGSMMIKLKPKRSGPLTVRSLW